MYMRYVVMDEIELEFLKSTLTNQTMVFQSREEAILQAERWRPSWRIIEIPFFDDGDSVTGARGE